MKILVVDDEALLVKGIRFNLQSDGYEVITGSNGSDAVRLAQDPEVALIVLDVMMPEMDGLTACSKIREFSNVPIILLTAKADDMDKLIGFDNGADDYLTKPFIPGELLARVRAISRRQGEVVMDELEFEDLVLSLSNYTLEGNGKSMPLGPKEFEIMRLLMSAPNVIVPKEDFIVKVWGAESDAEDNNVEVYISFLRKKLKHLNSRVSITTVRKIGYRLEVSA